MTVGFAKILLDSLPEDLEIKLSLADKKYLTSGEIERRGISRQLLRYYTQQGFIRTIPRGKQRLYLHEDVLECLCILNEKRKK